MKEWICEEVPALTIEGKVISTMLHHEQELVRCKDCKHGEPGACGDGIDCDGVWHSDDWFCADGEPKAEPVKTVTPEFGGGGSLWWIQCSECGHVLHSLQTECPGCHNKINWEGWN